MRSRRTIRGNDSASADFGALAVLAMFGMFFISWWSQGEIQDSRQSFVETNALHMTDMWVAVEKTADSPEAFDDQVQRAVERHNTDPDEDTTLAIDYDDQELTVTLRGWDGAHVGSHTAPFAESNEETTDADSTE